MKYIEEVIFSPEDKTLYRSDLEMLLLRELGTAYNSQLLDYAFSLATRSNPHCINPIEFHSFIASKDMSRYTVKRYLKHACLVCIQGDYLLAGLYYGELEIGNSQLRIVCFCVCPITCLTITVPFLCRLYASS